MKAALLSANAPQQTDQCFCACTRSLCGNVWQQTCSILRPPLALQLQIFALHLGKDPTNTFILQQKNIGLPKLGEVILPLVTFHFFESDICCLCFPADPKSSQHRSSVDIMSLKLLWKNPCRISVARHNTSTLVTLVTPVPAGVSSAVTHFGRRCLHEKQE